MVAGSSSANKDQEVTQLGKHSKKSAAPAQEAQIKEFLDMISPGIIKFNVDHVLCGNP